MQCAISTVQNDAKTEKWVKAFCEKSNLIAEWQYHFVIITKLSAAGWVVDFVQPSLAHIATSVDVPIE